MKHLSVVFIVLLFSFTLHAQTEHQESPFTAIIENQCGEESVAITGTIYGSITANQNKNNISIHSEWGPRGDVKAIGLTSGNTYNVTGHTNSKWASFQTGLTRFGYADEFNIVGLYKVHYNFEWTILEVERDGEWISRWRTLADNFRAVCQ